MAFRISLSLCLLAGVFLCSCAGTEADLERARYLLGEANNKDAALEALNIVTPILESSDASDQLEAYRLYAGAQMTLAGFDGARIVAATMYKTSDNTVTIMRSAVTSEDGGDARLQTTENKLVEYTGSSAFTNFGDSRRKNGILFQLGLVRFFKALRVAVVDTGLASAEDPSTFTAAQCRDALQDATKISGAKTDLNNSQTSLEDSGLALDNKLVVLVKKLDDSIPDSDLSKLTDFCNYIEGQAGATE